MAKKTNKTSHVLNLITGSQSSAEEAEPTQQAQASSTPAASGAAPMPASAPSNVTVVDTADDEALSDTIKQNLLQELEKETASAQADGETQEPPETDKPAEAAEPEKTAEPEKIPGQPEAAASEEPAEKLVTESESERETGTESVSVAEPETPEEAAQAETQSQETAAVETSMEQTVAPERVEPVETTADPGTSESVPPSNPQEEPKQPTPPAEEKAPVPAPPSFRVLNVMEEILTPEVTLEMMEKNDVCHCQRCQADVRALMLTRLQPKYVVAERSAIPMLMTYYRNKFRVAILSQSLRACIDVKENPRH